jgi:5'-methylthioadenosine phosphorylase
MATHSTATLGVIGGSGFYEFIADPTWVTVSTPFGEPSSPLALGRVAGRDVAFLPRHGRNHEFPPHRVNYRANIWALRSVGVRRIVAPCAVGSLQPDVGPGAVVVPDQLVDRTTSRPQTFYDEGAVHVGFADPYCPTLRAAVIAADPTSVDGGTLVVVEGPRFSTRAESQWYAAQGWSLVGMTGHPEAVLARELALCYAAVALVTDRDAGVSSVEAVLSDLPDPQNGCRCSSALDGLALPFDLP